MAQAATDLFEKLDRLPQEYFDFLAEVDRLMLSTIDAEYLLDNIYNYVRQADLTGRYELIPKGRAALEKAEKFQKEILNSKEAFGQIVRYIDDMNDHWTWMCRELEDFYDNLKRSGIQDLIVQFGDVDQLTLFGDLLEYLHRYKGRENDRPMARHRT